MSSWPRTMDLPKEAEGLHDSGEMGVMFSTSDQQSGGGGAAASQSAQWGQASAMQWLSHRKFREGSPGEEDPEGGVEATETAAEVLEVWGCRLAEGDRGCQQ